MARRAGDWAWVLREALRVYSRPTLMVTVTAPGDDVLPRDVDGYCHHLQLAEWCATIPARWHGLRHKCSLKAKRSESGPVVLAYVWQLQKRGAPHLHILVPAEARGQIFADAVKASAADYGFGFVDIKSGGESALAAASYVSRYLTRDIENWRSEYAQYLPKRPAYVYRGLTQASGTGIRVARKLRHLWVFANVDDTIGVPKFNSDLEESSVYYWYRIGLRGLDNVNVPAILLEKRKEVSV